MMMSPLTNGGYYSGKDASVSLQSILKAVRMHLGMDVGFISEFSDGRRVFRHVETAAGKECIQVGDSDPLEESYCYWITQGKLPQLIQDPRKDAFASSFAVTEALPVGAHLSVPILLRDGQLYGTFCCFSFEPDRSLNERDLATMEAFAQVASAQIQQVLDNGKAHQTKLARITEILSKRDLQMVFQPAVRLNTPRIEFVEALARFYSTPYQSPDRWFLTAAEVGLGVELELLAVSSALEALKTLPSNTAISINVSPGTVLSPGLISILNSAPLSRLILEITEHEAVPNYSRVSKALHAFRKQGLRVAVDDTGAGYSSFRHILKFKPDLIKLDLSLTRGIDKDPARRALAAALISFAREIGSELVAEGVETELELSVLKALGVNIVQGYLLSEPMPAGEADGYLRLYTPRTQPRPSRAPPAHAIN